MSKWKVTLFNQHAQCGICAYGRTRRQAFYNAFNRAGPQHRWYGLTGDRTNQIGDDWISKVNKDIANGQDIMWLAAFNDAMAHMRNGYTSMSHMNPRGFGVEIRRV